MITNFKIYETVYRRPIVGDYVIGLTNYGVPSITSEIFGQITKINSEDGVVSLMGFDGMKYIINIKGILYWAETKEEIEMFVQANKYNL